MSTRNSYQGLDPKLVKMVKRKAAKAVGKTGIRKCDVPDIEQDLMLSLFKGMRRYDSAKSKRATYASVLLNARMNGIYRSRSNPAKSPQFNWKTLNIKIEIDAGEPVELIDLIDTDGELVESEPTNSGLPECLSIDINKLTEQMPKKLRKICNCLKTMTVTETARKMKLSRSAIYRNINTIRQIFIAGGMESYLYPNP